MATSSKTTQTALCLIPPENLWQQIQDIRATYDKAYPRWMPHINLIYPFVPEADFVKIKSQLEPILRRRKPFQLRFDTSSFQYFKQKSNACTFHLRPITTTDVVELQQNIQHVLPSFATTGRAFEAHLTLGQTTTSRISDILVERKAKWNTIEFEVDRVYLISRENNPDDMFTIKDEILLASDDQQEEEQLEMKVEPLAPQSVIAESHFQPSKMHLCIVPPSEFSSRLVRLFEDTSFRALKPFRLIVAEYDEWNPAADSDLRSRLESTPKFTLEFGPRSICFNYSTARLFLKPIDIEPIRRLHLGGGSDNDQAVTMTLGELDKKDLDEVGDRFTRSWTAGLNEFEVDRLHLVDTNGRFKFVYRLRSQCFS